VINQLVGGGDQLTATLSRKHGDGRHTTVISIMLELSVGGYIVDSPGVRDYAPAIVSEDDAIRGYREINDAGGECRFGNCKHLREPDCAVKRALECGTISARRYESYKRLISFIRNRNIH
ncbi:MAG: GTPase RsgA, partial [Pseudomonadota bacterium]|nr:GTPase RsgA [Pseudomonadota bacterium]